MAQRVRAALLPVAASVLLLATPGGGQADRRRPSADRLGGTLEGRPAGRTRRQRRAARQGRARPARAAGAGNDRLVGARGNDRCGRSATPAAPDQRRASDRAATSSFVRRLRSQRPPIGGAENDRLDGAPNDRARRLRQRERPAWAAGTSTAASATTGSTAYGDDRPRTAARSNDRLTRRRGRRRVDGALRRGTWTAARSTTAQVGQVRRSRSTPDDVLREEHRRRPTPR